MLSIINTCCFRFNNVTLFDTGMWTLLEHIKDVSYLVVDIDEEAVQRYADRANQTPCTSSDSQLRRTKRVLVEGRMRITHYRLRFYVDSIYVGDFWGVEDYILTFTWNRHVPLRDFVQCNVVVSAGHLPPKQIGDVFGVVKEPTQLVLRRTLSPPLTDVNQFDLIVLGHKDLGLRTKFHLFVELEFLQTKEPKSLSRRSVADG
jgi:hypothetical protein